MDPLLPLCVRAIRRWTGELAPLGEADASSLASLLLRVPVDSLARFLRSGAGPVEGTSASPLPSPTTTGPAFLAFILQVALGAARRRALEATPTPDPQRHILEYLYVPSFLRLLRQVMLRAPGFLPVAAPTTTTATQDLPMVNQIEGPITNRMIRNLLIACHSGHVASRKEMIVIWGSLQSLRYVLSYIHNQQSAPSEHEVVSEAQLVVSTGEEDSSEAQMVVSTGEEDSSEAQLVVSTGEEDPNGAQLLVSKGPTQRIVTNVDEAENLIAQWHANDAELVVDVPTDMSLGTLNGIMVCFTKHGARELLSGPNLTNLLQSMQEFVGYLG